MTTELTRAVNDTGPPVTDTLKTDGTADDLTGATVAFSMWPASGTGGAIDANTSNVTVTDAANGQVKYEFVGGDLDTAGNYRYQWRVTFSDGGVRSYPNDEPGVPLTVTRGAT